MAAPNCGTIGTYTSMFHIEILQHHEVIKKSLASSGTAKNRVTSLYEERSNPILDNRVISNRRTVLRCFHVPRLCTFREQRCSSPPSVPSPIYSSVDFFFLRDSITHDRNVSKARQCTNRFRMCLLVIFRCLLDA